MHKDRPGHEPPDNPQALIWRYLDLPKFLSLIHRSSLYFASLGSMEDEYEGALSEPYMNRIVMAYNQGRSDHGAEPLDKVFLGTMNRLMLNNYYEAARAGVFVNCWHRSEHESG